MPNTLFDWLRHLPPKIWGGIVCIVAFNAWYDYYHPLGLIVDGIILAGLIIWFAGSRSG